MSTIRLDQRPPKLTLFQKLGMLSLGQMLLVAALGGIGVAALYSAANGSMEPWASRQVLRFGLGLALMLALALVDIRVWMKLAYPIYGSLLALLAAVEVAGKVGGLGAQRWINLGPLQIQPSELMKVALVLALARYFHTISIEEAGRPSRLILPLGMVLAPAGLVLMQPNLGTALMLILCGGAIFLLAGVRWWKFAAVIALGAAALPFAWGHMHDYQKKRVLTFLDPAQDPLGAGYHITQSKIALGSGGVGGTGFLQGSQSHLNFLPEKQTDFIFTLWAEEEGMVGALVLLGLFALVILIGTAIGLRSHNQFGRVLALGLSVNLFLYVFINIAMVMGLIPVVGVPLPLISYGGTSMLAVMIGFGLQQSVLVHRAVRMARRYPFEEP